MKNQLKIGLMAAIFLASNLMAEAQPKMPKMVIKTIKNDTPFNLLLADRFNSGKSIIIAAGQTLESNLEIIGAKNVIINGSMSEIMAEKAQFVIKKLDTSSNVEPEKEAYINMCTVPGGVNDGSNIITGTPGTVAFKFFMAGKKGGCGMSSGRLKNDTCALLEINLEFYMQESDIKNDIFRLFGDYAVVEK